jgi:hypothetical protein
MLSFALIVTFSFTFEIPGGLLVSTILLVCVLSVGVYSSNGVAPNGPRGSLYAFRPEVEY